MGAGLAELPKDGLAGGGGYLSWEGRISGPPLPLYETPQLVRRMRSGQLLFYSRLYVQ